MARPDMYEIPLWEQITRVMRLLDTALSEAKQRGIRWVEADAHYQTVKSEKEFEMKAAGYPVTFIQDCIKGIPQVNEALRERNIADVEYENAREARNVLKKQLDTLREQYQREWAQAKEE